MLDIQDLCKNYGKFKAVDHLNLHINKGELFGFVGHNGAGKTTTMKIMAGLTAATSGQVLIDGVDALKDPRAVKSKIGYMPDFFGVYDNLKAIEYMEFYASLYGLTGKQAKKTCLELMDLVNLSDKADSFVDSLSRGMKQRLCLARCLVHDPGLLILDEPASGLDPRARYEMKEILKTLSTQGKTIIISSHILPELADMCTAIGIMQKGQLIMQGSVDEIRAQSKLHGRLNIHVLAHMDRARLILENESQASGIKVNGDTLICDYAGDEIAAARLLQRLLGEGVLVDRYYKDQDDLEAMFLELTGDEAGVGGSVR